MAIITPIEFDVDLSTATQVEALPNILVQGDAKAYEIIVHIFRNGVPIDVTGASVVGTGMLTGNISVFAEGSAEGNTARFVMGAEFFAKKGKLTVMMTVTMNGTQITVFSGITNVLKSAMDTSIADNGAFPAAALIEAAKNEEERIEAEAKRAENYEMLLAVKDRANDVLNAYQVKATEEEEGHVVLGTGIDYDPQPAINALREKDAQHDLLIAANTAGVSEAKAAAASVSTRVDGIAESAQQAETDAAVALSRVDAKLNKNVGLEHVGKTLVVDEKGDIIPGESTFWNTLVKTVKLEAWPVGAIYTSINPTSPDELFGGTWKRLSEMFLVGAGEANSQFAPGSYGGSVNHKHTTGDCVLSLANLPPHTHSFNAYGSENTGTVVTVMQNTTSSYNTPTATNSGDGLTGTAHNHGDTEYASNLPPFMAVYMWQRER